MSIADEINSALGAGRLFHLELSLPSDPVSRALLIHPEIKQALIGPWSGESEERRLGRLKADLEAFVIGRVISMCLTPFNHKRAYMGLLAPPGDGVFDIRSRDPSPGMRVFGRFAMPDVFVALNFEFRSTTPDWSDRIPLSRDPLQFYIAASECIKRWNELFSIPPIAGENVSDYITTDAFLV